MKYFYLIFLFYTHAQLCLSQCSPNSNLSYAGNWGGIPSPTDMLDTAIINELFTQVIYFRAPTTVGDVSPYNCAPACNWDIEEVQLVRIDGLETTGMNQSDVSCNTPDCSFQGGEDGCMVIYGLPSTGGHHNIWIKMTAIINGGIFGTQTQDFTISDYFIYVANPVSSDELQVNKKNLLSAYSTDQNTLMVSMTSKTNSSNYNLRILSLDGREIKLYEKFNETKHISLKKGMYFIELSNKNGQIIEIKKVIH